MLILSKITKKIEFLAGLGTYGTYGLQHLNSIESKGVLKLIPYVPPVPPFLKPYVARSYGFVRMCHRMCQVCATCASEMFVNAYEERVYI